MSELAEVIADLRWAATYWPDLTESRLPGTARPWRQTQMTTEQAAARDEQARVERDERSVLALGPSAAPVDVGVLDMMTELLADAVMLADQIERVTLGLLGPEPPSTAFADARPYLIFAARHLPENLAEWAAPTARRLVNAIAQALAMVYTGQHLDLVCPWCSEAATWRVQELPGGMIAIVCSGVCEPPARDVGTWWGGQPCWPLQDWPRLAGHVRAADIKRAREAEMKRVREIEERAA